MTKGVAAVWWATLLADLLGLVPAIVALLERTLSAARSVERYTAEIETAAAGIARNTASVAALQETIAAATAVSDATEAIGRNLTAIGSALATAPREDGRAEGARGA